MSLFQANLPQKRSSVAADNSNSNFGKNDETTVADSDEPSTKRHHRSHRPQTRPSSEGPSLLWLEKYQPIYLDEMDLHQETNKLLMDVAKSKELPHMLLYGPHGGGKMTRVYGLLREIFGDSVDKNVKCTTHTIQHPPGSSVKFEIFAKTSPHHMEVNLPDVGIRDSKVAKTLLKDFTATKPIGGGFKVVILKSANLLSNDCQMALRRLIELRSESTRFIFVSSCLSGMLAPIQSRCFALRVPLPNENQVSTICKNVLQKEMLSNLIPTDEANSNGNSISDPDADYKIKLDKIIHASECDLRKALLRLEVAATSPSPSNPQNYTLSPWEDLCESIAASLMNGPFVARTILNVREKFYILLSAAVEPEIIIDRICCEIDKVFPAASLIVWGIAAMYDDMMKKCNKEIFVLEAFAVRMLSTIAQATQQQ